MKIAMVAPLYESVPLAESLLSDDFFSGWGIRTVATGESRYNPMSYHNGSVWPHDNAMIAHGFSKYGNKDAVLKVLRGMFDLSYFVDQHRLPSHGQRERFFFSYKRA